MSEWVLTFRDGVGPFPVIMKLAIASRSKPGYTETFVAMQEGKLPCALRIYGKPVASETQPGGAVTLANYARSALLSAGAYKSIWSQMHGSSPKEAAKAAFSQLQSQEIKRRLRRNGVSVLLANFGPCAVGLAPVCYQLGIPLVAHFHGYDAHTTQVVEYYRDAYKNLGQQAAAIVVVSSTMRNALEEMGLPSHKMHLARCGVDPDMFTEKTHFPSSPLYFAIGRFTEKKAPYMTVLAFNALLERVPDAKLVLAGDGEYLEVTRNIIEGLGIKHCVELPGKIGHDSVARYMQDATAFVQHSLTPRSGLSAGDKEGTPVAVMEAMMTGLPVISTRHAGIGEVIRDGETGFLVEERDVQGMASAMAKVAASTAYAQQVGKAAREEALQHFSAKQYIGKLKAILDTVSK